jgi:hypothetical protein
VFGWITLLEDHLKLWACCASRKNDVEPLGYAIFFSVSPSFLSAYQPPASSAFLSEQTSTSNQPAVLFSQNKPAPAISHQSNEQALEACCCYFLLLDVPVGCLLNVII